MTYLNPVGLFILRRGRMTTMKNNLPEFSFAHSDLNGVTMKIIRGEMGFHHDENALGYSADELNFYEGITKEQAKAMEVGALWGWDVPGADPDYHKPGAIQRSTGRRGKLVG